MKIGWNFPSRTDLKKLRKMANITRPALGKSVGLSESAIVKIEQKDHIPNYDNMVNIFKQIEKEFQMLSPRDERPIKDIMEKNVISFKLEDAIEKVISTINETQITQFPIIDNGSLVGTITSNNIVDFESGSAVKEYMSSILPNVGETVPIFKIIPMFKEFSAVLLTEKGTGKVTGIVTPQDVVSEKLTRSNIKKVKR